MVIKLRNCTLLMLMVNAKAVFTSPESTVKTIKMTCFLTPEIPTHGGNANGARCAQPFYYQGVAYYGCINALHNQFWCSTTRSYDQNKIWGNCDLDVAPAGMYKRFT